MLGVFITLWQTLCLGYRWIHSSVWPQPTGANRHSCPSPASELAPVISILLQSSLQPSSLPTYQRAWKLFSQFLHIILPSVSTTLPISPPVLALFIAYMYDRHYAPSTVTTYVSALGFTATSSQVFLIPPRPFLSFRCLRVMESLGLFSIVGCQLPFQF